METIKKYWWAIAIGVYLMFFNKPKKKRKYKRPSYIRRRVARYQSKKRWNRKMRAMGYRR
jgi:hypothetical protein